MKLRSAKLDINTALFSGVMQFKIAYKMKHLLIVLALVAAVYGRAVKLGIDNRIVGGKPVDISEVPYQVSLEYHGSHICGGTIISARWVVTAAHCTDGSSAGQLQIRAGTATRGSGGVRVAVKKINQHPNYNSYTVDYDISILELSTPLQLSSNIAAAGIPTTEPSDGTKVVVSGWGTVKEGANSLPSKLQVVTVQIVGRSACQANYGSASITTRMLCAGVNGGGKDACQGDSGGPLVVNNHLHGVVSWGYGCARPKYPGVYSSVANLRSYIKQITGL